MSYFAIRHKPTGNYMPVARGGSTGISAYTLERGRHPPRLFTTRKGAQCALTWWLDGEQVAVYAEDGWGGHTGWRTDHKTDRHKADVEVVEVTFYVTGRVFK